MWEGGGGQDGVKGGKWGNCNSIINKYIKIKKIKNTTTALAGELSGLSAGLQTKGLPVQFPVRAHAWVAGQVLSRGRARGTTDSMFLSLSPSLSLKTNK